MENIAEDETKEIPRPGKREFKALLEIRGHYEFAVGPQDITSKLIQLFDDNDNLKVIIKDLKINED